MMLCDLHFHANIGRTLNKRRGRRLNVAAANFEASGLDYVASTEHAYKRPLDAYLRLTEATMAGRTTIIPGVEEVSSEGIDIIFLFKDEDEYRWGLKAMRTFFWSVRDVAQISRELNAITIVPHPFHLGRTSAGHVLPLREYLTLLKNVDYVEVHNGSALNINHRITKSGMAPFVPHVAERLGHTLDLPHHLRGGNETGWSIGSDAHYPNTQYVVGSTDRTLGEGEHIFDLLRQRIHFSPYTVKDLNRKTRRNCINILREFQGVIREGATKRCKKGIARAQSLVNF